MSKETIHVFPDHSASGLWAPDGIMVDVEEFNFTPLLQIALRHWVELWEYAIVEDKMSNSYIRQWKKDGEYLTRLMNEQAPEYDFVLDLNHIVEVEQDYFS